MSRIEKRILSSLEGRSGGVSASAVEAAEPFCLVEAVCRERRFGLWDAICCGERRWWGGDGWVREGVVLTSRDEFWLSHKFRPQIPQPLQALT